jgi:hypothetical protein
MSAKERPTHPPQKRVINPIVMLPHDPGIPPPGDALLETAPPLFVVPTRGVSRYVATFGSSDVAELERLLENHAILKTTGPITRSRSSYWLRSQRPPDPLLGGTARNATAVRTDVTRTETRV